MRAAEEARAAYRFAEAGAYDLEAAAAFEEAGQVEQALTLRGRAQMALTPRGFESEYSSGQRASYCGSNKV